ncbi:uncharacterized protein LOC131238834 [Magnolia sinica]|uniref:uncharacterized protein LOC131238834 n=1 Tax=Magnolia sinica TaxID=86752 RepID=UPI002659C426|nr:uncharacterized protein LOC131238834 [Magnolia sinica]
MSPPSLEEVHLAVRSLLRDGARGPDGFLGAFFIGSWHIVGQDILKVMTFLFSGEDLPRAFSVSHICLIPKIPTPKKFADFRSISLCNCIYKIFSKMITSKLSKVLPKLISRKQGPFVQGHSIAKNFVIAQEMIRDLNRKIRGGNIVLKLDMEKAFLINGAASSFFKSERGLQQGDPISPSLFIIVIKVFSKGFAQWVSSGSCLPYKLSRGCPLISHLLYVDDTLIFLNGGLVSLHEVKRFLCSSQVVSGRKINLSKSSFLYSSKLSSARIRNIESPLQVRKAGLCSIYLGVLLIHGRVRRSNLLSLVHRVENRNGGWKARCLSQVGRVVFIQHVLGSCAHHGSYSNYIVDPIRAGEAIRQLFLGLGRGQEKALLVKLEGHFQA